MKYKNAIVCTKENKPLTKVDKQALDEFIAFRIARKAFNNNREAWDSVEKYRKEHGGKLPPLPKK